MHLPSGHSSDPAVLIVDNDAPAGALTSRALQDRGHRCVLAGSGAEAFEFAGGQFFDLMVVDMRLPDTDGLRLLRRLRDCGQTGAAIVTAERPSVRMALEALACDASDFIPKPCDADQIMHAAVRAIGDTEDVGAEYLWDGLGKRGGRKHIMSLNPRTRQAYLTAARVARSAAPVLITGESGTGKEFLAHAIHELSGDEDRPMVVLNCGALPEELLESELFGHEKGAFTSATSARAGLCELADGGTLFLDEIGDMSLQMQVKLLRFLQDGTFRRLGGSRERQVQVRVIAATNQDLNAAIRASRFREDLYWRINVIGLHLPPLRERPEDVEQFTVHYLEQYAHESTGQVLQLSDSALKKLQAYEWPGNLRQLHNVVLRAALLCGGSSIGAGHLHIPAV